MKQIAWFSAGLFLITMLFLTKYLLKFFSPLLFGLIIAIIIHPVVDKLEKRRINRSVSSFLIIIIILIGFVLIMGFVINGLWQEMDQLLEIVQLLVTEKSPFAKFSSYVVDLLPNHFPNLFELVIDKSSQLIFTLIKDLTEFITYIPNFIFHFVVTALTSFLISRDKPLVISFLISATPEKYLKKFIVFKQEVIQGLLTYIKVQLLLMFISGGLSTVCFLLINQPYPWLLGSIVGFLDLIPMVGPSWVFLPATLYYLFNQEIGRTLAIALIWIVVSLIRSIWEPKIIGHQLGLHPLTSLVGIYLGVAILGFTGFIIGPLLMICCKAFYNVFLIEL